MRNSIRLAYLLSICSAFSINFADASSFPVADDAVPIGQVQIADRFDTVEVTRKTFAVEAKKCIPQFELESQGTQDYLEHFPNNNTLGVRYAGSSNTFLVRKTTALCLHSSTENFPIFAAEAFYKTANPKGVPPEVADEWYRQIALMIATKGSAKVAFAFENGNAFIVTYQVDPETSYKLCYSMVFNKSGEWKAEDLDAQYSHPLMKSLSQRKRSNATVKNDPLAHRFE